MIPGLRFLPKRNIGAAAPWSVPPLAFCSTRRPNSLKVIIATRSSFFWLFKSFQKALMPYEHLLPAHFRGRNERIDERF